VVLLAAALSDDPDVEAAVRASLVVELTHVASLYHDDVMDEAELRRGAPSANARWRNSVAIWWATALSGPCVPPWAQLRASGPHLARSTAQVTGAFITGVGRIATSALLAWSPVPLSS
jgi:geranylgeranyl pyrophosphate synthase